MSNNFVDAYSNWYGKTILSSNLMFKSESNRKLETNNISKSDIKQVIYNNPATIVYFTDGSKVVVKTMDGDEFNEEVGLALAIMKKMFGSSTAFKKFAKKWKETE